MLHVDDDGNEYLLHHHCYELQTALTRLHHHIIILLSYVDILNDQDKCRVRIVYFVLLCIPSPEKKDLSLWFNLLHIILPQMRKNQQHTIRLASLEHERLSSEVFAYIARSK